MHGHLPIFIISLVDSEWRRSSLVKRLAEFGMSATVFPAVDGRSGLPPESERLIDRKATGKTIFRTPSDAEFACALSHNALYSKIAGGDAEYAVILEDDAILLDSFPSVVGCLNDKAFDILLLDHKKAYVSGNTMALTSQIEGRQTVLPPELTTGYVISKSMASLMSTASLPISGTADWPIDISRFRTFAAVPRVVDHPDPTLNSQIATSRERTVSSNRWRRFLMMSYWKKKLKKVRFARVS